MHAASLQGVWRGSCATRAVANNASDVMSSGRCIPQTITYDYEIAYNGTMAGANISGSVLPL